jgi:hypothetical protein
VIASAADPTVHAALPYERTDNAPVLEHLIRTALQARQPKLSAILG